ncbi:MAG: 30S ribosomal protein S5 [Candidatus Magasanikbacteria bacterium]|nr:30S ribosomal protein S5 [Candidatus Magasanikbacteria bacterium]
MAFHKGKGKRRRKREKPEFDQQIVDLARVTRVTKGGKQLSFRACVVIGDHKGRVGYGVDKGKDVQIAVEKAVNKAKKNMIRVPIVNDSIPHRVDGKYSAAKVMLKPAPRGSGVIAGSSVRVVLELAGVPNASAKILGKTNNKINNIKATFVCLESFLPKAKETITKNKVKKQKKNQTEKKIKKDEKKEKQEKK